MSDKQRKNLLKKEYRQIQEEQFLNSLPIPVAEFVELFDFVNDKLEQNGCDHSLIHVTHYLNANKLPEEKVINWLKENSGYCDCEVIYNVEELFEGL